MSLNVEMFLFPHLLVIEIPQRYVVVLLLIKCWLTPMVNMQNIWEGSSAEAVFSVASASWPEMEMEKVMASVSDVWEKPGCCADLELGHQLFSLVSRTCYESGRAGWADLLHHRRGTCFKKNPNVLDFTLGLCEDLKSLSFKYYFMHFLYCFQSCLYRLLNILINILNISKYIRNEHNCCLKMTKCYLNKIQIFDIQM